ncbi:MAG: peptidoglycan DD-metalloendopeptidase family protein [Nitrospirae bacterium]|nr:peptidoglycan DD-metalloendopeptidase family protein [Nitrospirota bacterium]
MMLKNPREEYLIRKRNLIVSAFNLILILFTLFFLHCPLLFAETPEAEYKKIQKEIKTHEQKLKEVKKREFSVLSEIENTNKQLKKIDSDLKKYRNKIIQTNSKISEIEFEISQHKSNIERNSKWIKRKLRAIHKYGYYSDIMMLFMNSTDISQIIRNGKYLQYIVKKEHAQLKLYTETVQSLSMKEKQLMALREELLNDTKRVKEEEQLLAQRKRSKEIFLASIKSEESTYKKMLKELKDASNRLIEIIRKSEKTEDEEGFSTTNFAKLRGKLPWPVEGKVVIPYGSQKDPQFNTPIFRSGTYIKADNDKIAKAVHSGKVVFAEWFKGYGQLVIVNHGSGYHTLYGSLSEIFTKVGDIIKVSQAIGRIGTSGIIDVPGLYFELRYKGKPLDPIRWLKSR